VNGVQLQLLVAYFLQEAHKTLQKARNDAAAQQTAQLQLHAAELQGVRKQRDEEASDLRQEIERFRGMASEAQGRATASQAELDACKQELHSYRTEVRAQCRLPYNQSESTALSAARTILVDSLNISCMHVNKDRCSLNSLT
jgi:chromosome segregation ATPase